jgi:hypothetical protein
MSGRLIILPHKSWHVWNRDNVEKVKRDERLHKEEQERKAERQRWVGSFKMVVHGLMRTGCRGTMSHAGLYTRVSAIMQGD